MGDHGLEGELMAEGGTAIGTCSNQSGQLVQCTLNGGVVHASALTCVPMTGVDGSAHAHAIQWQSGLVASRGQAQEEGHAGVAGSSTEQAVAQQQGCCEVAEGVLQWFRHGARFPLVLCLCPHLPVQPELTEPLLVLLPPRQLPGRVRLAIGETVILLTLSLHRY